MIKEYDNWYGKTKDEGYDSVEEAQNCINAVIEDMIALKERQENCNLVLKVSIEQRIKNQYKDWFFLAIFIINVII